MQCTATSKQSGRQCKKSAVVGFEVCHIHGGKSPGGIASATLRTGRYSKYIPSALQADYEAALMDDELTSLRDEIALTDSEIAEQLRLLEDANTAANLVAARAAYEAFIFALRRKDKQAQGVALRDIDTATAGGADIAAVQGRLDTLLERRRRLVESERKSHDTMNRNQAMLLVGYLAATVKEHVTDQDALIAIQRDITRLLTSRVGESVSAE